MSSEESPIAIIAALAANVGIAITKFIAFFLTGASSMLAEAIHSCADSGNQLLLLLGGKRAKKAADERHPFGYGVMRYLYAFIVSIVLFSIGGVFSLYEAYHKWHESEKSHGGSDLITSQWWWVPFVVLVVAIAMESASFATAIKQAKKMKGDDSYVQFVRRTRDADIAVIMLEDLAALLGLMFALVGLTLAKLTHEMKWDAVGTAFIGVLLVLVAVFLAMETKSLLLGEAAIEEEEKAIHDALQNEPVVEEVVHLRTMHLGPDTILVACKVAVDPHDTAQETARMIDAAEKSIRSAISGKKLYIYIEPDILRPGQKEAGASPAT